MCATDSVPILLLQRTTSGTVHTVLQTFPPGEGRRVQTTSIHMYSEVSQRLAMQHSKIPMTAVFFWTCKLYLQQVFIFFSCLSFVFTMEKPLLIFSCSLFSCDTSMSMSFTLIIFTTGKNPSWGEDDAKAHHSFREEIAGELLTCRPLLCYFTL